RCAAPVRRPPTPRPHSTLAQGDPPRRQPAGRGDLLGRGSRRATAPDVEQPREQRARGPDPGELAREDRGAARGEEGANAERRDRDRREGEEEAPLVEGGEERHAEPAVGAGVEEAVGGRREEEIQPRARAGQGCEGTREGRERDQRSECASEGKR